MTTYEFRYTLQSAPAPRTDGGAQVSHDIFSMYRVAGSQDGWQNLHHKDVLIPAADVLTVMAMPDASGAQKTAKNDAYKDLLVQYRNASAISGNTDLSSAAMQAFLDANDVALDGATQIDNYITVTLSQSYPLSFSI